MPSVPTSWSHYARRMGIHSPPSGHPQNKRWAMSARTAGNECPYVGTNLGQYKNDNTRRKDGYKSICGTMSHILDLVYFSLKLR